MRRRATKAQLSKAFSVLFDHQFPQQDREWQETIAKDAAALYLKRFAEYKEIGSKRKHWPYFIYALVTPKTPTRAAAKWALDDAWKGGGKR